MSQPHIDALKEVGLEEHLLCPGHALYEERLQSWWSATARLKPSCIFQAKTPEHVSQALRVLGRFEHGRFAIRSGGHALWAGGSNVDNGITIDLGHLNQVTYHKDSGTVSLGPGQQWGAVYEILEPHGVVVAGSRVGDVGVGGFVTGGGLSFYAGRSGFACDTVVNFQVVLADGRIVDANATTNPDLWKALKGGHGNMGIVTRIDMEAIPVAGPLWGGLAFSERKHAGDVIRAFVNFSAVSADHPENFLTIFTGYDPSLNDGKLYMAQVMFNTDGVVNPPLLKECCEVPSIMQNLQVKSMAQVVNATRLPSGRGNVWLTLTAKVDARLLHKSVEIHEKFVADLSRIIPATDFRVNSLWQLMPSSVTAAGVRKGGNVLGLDAVDEPFVVWLFLLMTKGTESQTEIHKLSVAMKDSLEEYAASIDCLLPWQYINYTDYTQKPLESYGPDNLAFLRQVAKKYDPSEFFQTRFPGGFTLSRAG